MTEIALIGTVVSGRGEGKKFLELPWVQQQLKEKLGFELFLGTLNLQLTHASVTQRKFLKKETSMGVCTSKGYCEGLLFQASIIGVAVGVVIPQTKDYPADELEIVGPVNLRETLRLHDGDEVGVTVYLQPVASR